jgi:glutamate racemase
MVPGLKPAANASRSRHVAILATPGTFDGDLYALVVDEFGAGTRIANVPAHGLAELVEQGRAGTPEARRSIRAALEAEVEAGADTVVLGCTHYHFLGEDIRGEFPALAIVDTSEAVARRTLQVLKESGLEAPQDGPGAVKFVTSGDREAFLRVAGRLGFAAPSEARR